MSSKDSFGGKDVLLERYAMATDAYKGTMCVHVLKFVSKDSIDCHQDVLKANMTKYCRCEPLLLTRRREGKGIWRCE